MNIFIAGNAGSGKTLLGKELLYRFKFNGFDAQILSFSDPLKQIFHKLGVFKSVSSIDIRQNMSFDAFKYYIQNYLIKYTFSLIDNNYLQNQNEDYYLYYFPKIVNIINKYETNLLNIYNNLQEHINYDETYRRLCQLVGTEIVQTIDKNFWCYLLHEKIKNRNKYYHVNIIDDFRFIHEYKFIKTFYKNTLEKKEYMIIYIENDVNLNCDIYNHSSEKEIGIIKDMIKNDYVFYFTKDKINDKNINEFFNDIMINHYL